MNASLGLQPDARRPIAHGALLLAALAAALAGCRTPPPPHPAVEAARQAVQQASANPNAARGASVELGLARADLARADTAWQKDRDPALTAHLAHLAHQRALVAGQIGQQLEAESKLAQAAQQREQLRADATRRGSTVAAAPAAAAPAAAPLAPRVLTPAPAAASAAAPAVEPPARPPSPGAASRFDSETGTRARAELESQRRRGEPAAAPPQAAAAATKERDAALRRQLEGMQARSTERGMVLTLPDVLFESGGATLKPGSGRTVDQLAALMRRFPERRVLLEGFTDDVGPETVNYDLSQRRAEAFRAALLARGADARRIDVSAQGEAFPVARNDTAAGRAQNRRVEVIFSDEQGRFAPR